MRKICLLVALIGTFYVLSYEGHYFDPCRDGRICLAINGYNVQARDVICDSLKCVEDTLNRPYGTEHLNGVYKIEYFRIGDVQPSVQIEEVKIKKKVTVE